MIKRQVAQLLEAVELGGDEAEGGEAVLSEVSRDSLRAVYELCQGVALGMQHRCASPLAVGVEAATFAVAVQQWAHIVAEPSAF